MKEQTKILQIVSSLNQGSGVLQVVLNWHKNIDRTKVQFDYLYFIETDANCKDEIKNLGGNIYKLPYPSLLKPWIFIKAVIQFFKNNRYKTIHSHVTHLNLFFYPIAKFYGVKNIIQHVHGTKWSDKFLNGIRNYCMLNLVWGFITKKLACSQSSGKFCYGKNFEVVNNGIDIEKFYYDENIRNEYRKKLNVENNFVIGHIGRFSREKNHTFLIDVFCEILKQDNTAILILVGTGPLENQIKEKVNKLNLQNSVKFLGSRSDCNNLYQVMDLFMLPSTQEGLPMTGLEAQANGLPCIFSMNVPKDILILPESKRFDLNLPIKSWVTEILKYKNIKRNSDNKLVKKSGFNIKETSKQIQKIYEILE